MNASIATRVRLALCALAAALAAAPHPARAALLWNWTYTAPAIAAAGTFTTTDAPDAQGNYLITAISGARNGITISALTPPGEEIPGNAVDDLISAQGLLTKSGFGFEMADGTYANPFFLNGYLEVYTQPPFTGFTEGPITFSATQIPEPATAPLFLAAALSLAAIARRRVRADERDVPASHHRIRATSTSPPHVLY